MNNFFMMLWLADVADAFKMAVGVCIMATVFASLVWAANVSGNKEAKKRFIKWLKIWGSVVSVAAICALLSLSGDTLRTAAAIGAGRDVLSTEVGKHAQDAAIRFLDGLSKKN